MSDVTHTTTVYDAIITMIIRLFMSYLFIIILPVSRLVLLFTVYVHTHDDVLLIIYLLFYQGYSENLCHAVGNYDPSPGETSGCMEK